MKAKLMLAISSFSLLTGVAHAEGYPAQQGSQAASGYPAQQGYQAPSGYPAQQGYQASPGYPAQPGYQAPSGYPAQPGYQVPAEPHKHHKHHKDKDKFSLNINIPGSSEGIVITDHGIRSHSAQPKWISARAGRPLPDHLVVSGNQPNPPATLFVCRGSYRGGLHPGKLYQGQCNIGWGGREVSLSSYEVLVSRRPLHWVRASYGSIPAGAIKGGYHQGGPLYICQAEFNGGLHSGKVVGQNCNFGWGGEEISVPYYKVLVD